MKTTFRYDRNDINDTVRVAKQVSQADPNLTVYVYATSGGFTVSRLIPPVGQSHYSVRNGTVTKCNW